MGKEISSIIPDVKRIGDKKVIAHRVTTQQPEEINFLHNLSAYTPHLKRKDFNPQNQIKDLMLKREFLKRVNLDYGKISLIFSQCIDRKQLKKY